MATEPTSDTMSITLPERAARISRRGHPWFYADDLASQELPKTALVRVRAPGGRDLGLGMTSNGSSKIALRLCGPWEGSGVPEVEEFLDRRLSDAIALREAGIGERTGERLVHSEADGVPGLVVDRYSDVIVIQSTSGWVEANRGAITAWLVARFSPAMVLMRGDLPVRKREGLAEEVRLLAGERVDEVEIEEDGVVHRVRPWDGHKTGFYLDQRPARARVRALAASARVLDLFSYQGAFALSALAGGAREAIAVDQSAEALARATAAAEAQELGPLTARVGNAFDVVRELRADGQSFDLVVLDPPPFCKSRREVEGGKRGYRDLNRIAMQLLAPGGRLITASCSYHLRGEMFEDVLRQASFDLPFRVFLEERLGAGADHPAWLRLPESEYLKVRVLRRVEDGTGVGDSG